MFDPIVFISRFRIKEGKLAGFKQFFADGEKLLQEEKPRTLLFLAYRDDNGQRMTIVHVFADADSMDLHVEGAEERSKEALEFLEPEGFEIYGSPSEDVMEMMREAAASGSDLSVQPEYLGGFLRLAGGLPPPSGLR
jgi:quinol monooxygenase YgiN